jgi:hypothetical protein
MLHVFQKESIIVLPTLGWNSIKTMMALRGFQVRAHGNELCSGSIICKSHSLHWITPTLAGRQNSQSVWVSLSANLSDALLTKEDCEYCIGFHKEGWIGVLGTLCHDAHSDVITKTGGSNGTKDWSCWGQNYHSKILSILLSAILDKSFFHYEGRPKYAPRIAFAFTISTVCIHFHNFNSLPLSDYYLSLAISTWLSCPSLTTTNLTFYRWVKNFGLHIWLNASYQVLTRGKKLKDKIYYVYKLYIFYPTTSSV